MAQLTLNQARLKLTSFSRVAAAYNLYLIDTATRNILVKEIRERGKKIQERHFRVTI